VYCSRSHLSWDIIWSILLHFFVIVSFLIWIVFRPFKSVTVRSFVKLRVQSYFCIICKGSLRWILKHLILLLLFKILWLLIYVFFNVEILRIFIYFNLEFLVCFKFIWWRCLRIKWIYFFDLNYLILFLKYF
jgi:hypothetical protein